MTTITPLPRMRSKRELIAAADEILNSTNGQTFDRAAQGKVENLLRAAELVDAPEIQQRDIIGMPHSLAMSFERGRQERVRTHDGPRDHRLFPRSAQLRLARNTAASAPRAGASKNCPT